MKNKKLLMSLGVVLTTSNILFSSISPVLAIENSGIESSEATETIEEIEEPAEVTDEEVVEEEETEEVESQPEEAEEVIEEEIPLEEPLEPAESEEMIEEETIEPEIVTEEAVEIEVEEPKETEEETEMIDDLPNYPEYNQEEIYQLAMEIMEQDLQSKNNISKMRAFSSGIPHVDSFLEKIVPYAIENSITSGILPSITIAQGALESAWGLSGLAVNANNLFGIKASDDWKGQVYNVITKEYINGKWIEIVAPFRKYNNWLGSINDHGDFFTSTAWRKENYKHVVGEKDYQKAAKALQAAGYATDPDYPAKLISIIQSYGLDKYDRVPILNVSYHMENFGWINKVGADLSLGHVGDNLRLEDLNLSFPNDPNLSINFSAHIQQSGWINNIKENKSVGNVGKSLRMEALKINLTGNNAKNYDIFYRTYSESIGWSAWAKNGEAAGTEGYAKKIQSLEIKLAWKGDNPVNTSGTAFRNFTEPQISYSSQLQYDGWTSFVFDGALSGTVGKSRRMESVKINLPSQPFSGGIEYQSHVEKYGWMSKVSNGQISGTVGEAKRLEAIKVNLTGEMAKQYDIYYRTHVQNFGWTGWAKNGTPSGSEGVAKRLEAIQIKLVKKGKTAPGSTSNAFYK
ncbi:glucosaminidase domain-containing protein [Jeotgalibaca ciconiae]|uniref:Mannosyl-glycoprotein endo-beta-N-acetylglucosamidase-like domain-containing protein n=1 Tax=Jeotgalibaca ciconiae TaxID=2496265 RepID=A0A3Q9BLV6_9LACT|nr:glucosaminidase domain-containing protein [Jeotgalibaca ciconiae]AZP04943.1 hypothetical protein EJN90_09990 [Jeotgalibaca ciconiae]